MLSRSVMLEGFDAELNPPRKYKILNQSFHLRTPENIPCLPGIVGLLVSAHIDNVTVEWNNLLDRTVGAVVHVQDKSIPRGTVL